jgi:uncharacterized protein (TIGR03084 family)
MLEQIIDFQAECCELADRLDGLVPAQWGRVTQFNGWTINDVVLHLHASDYMAMASVHSPDAYAALRAGMMEQRQRGFSMIEEARRRFPDLHGPQLLREWRDQAASLCTLLGAKDPNERLSWPGPGMAPRMFATARQMETWAHGQEIYDILGLNRVNRDRIRNIAFLGTKTYEWSFRNRGLPVPAAMPRVELKLPSGQVWTAGEAGGQDEISGEAVEFCQVVTQVRHVDDTHLKLTGKVARAWMQIAQCFAGAPVDPPAPGTRFRVEQPDD